MMLGVVVSHPSKTAKGWGSLIVVIQRVGHPALGFRVMPEAEIQFPEIRLLTGKGSSARYSNAMKGEATSYETVIFDFSYFTGAGKIRRGVNQTVAAFHSPGANMPEFQLTPRTLESKIKFLFGAKQLKLEASPNFS